MVEVTQKKSIIGVHFSQKRTMLALGLKKNGQSRKHQLTPAIKGMLRKVSHLVTVEKIEK